MNKRHLLSVIAIVTFAGLHFHAQAAITVYDDKTTFLAETGANPEAALPNLGTATPATFIVGDLTYSALAPSTAPASGTAGFGGIAPNPWTARISGNQIALGGTSENLQVALATARYSLGFDFVEPENDPYVNGTFIDSTFSVTLFNGLTLVDSFNFTAPNDTAAFVGVWGGALFNRIEIRETVGGAENEFFGQFYTGAIPTPIPPALLLFGSALLGLISIKKRS